MNNVPQSLELQTAIEAAKVGATTALKYFNKGIAVDYKEDKSPVTIADKKTEEAIKNFITSKFPGAKFVGEEFGGKINDDEFWIIDPIDGTRSFSRGVPEWCVMISVSKNNKI